MHRRLHTTGEWRAEAQRYLATPRRSRAPDSFTPFNYEADAYESDPNDAKDFFPELPGDVVPPGRTYQDSVHQSFGRSEGTRIVFNNVGQSDNTGASSTGRSAINRSRVSASSPTCCVRN